MRIDNDILEYVVFVSNKTALRPLLAKLVKHNEMVYEHSFNRGLYATQLGYEMGYRDKDLELLCEGALLCDIGMLDVPNKIINKKGKLNNNELLVMQKHVIFGDYTLKEANLPEEVIAIEQTHHLYLDKSGYPSKYDDRKITEMSQIVTTCDIYNALISKRPYKCVKSFAEALVVLYQMSNDGKIDESIIEVMAKNVSHLIISAKELEAVDKERNKLW